ncbi:MAG: CRISPR-associated endonuclease Cas2 [Spirochaetes bacterium]|uniref:CRISPR-associated endoribonuclease Cas2 n=1 Tax=Candidatus Ornithospirochaeta stercoripullorum TaxID=2840899 RepID=A0A9D9H5F1_9SPIO|nr:CRISPR-associated endonuclease Cas2 [Candidatus Ornithospirochaeta stercoripullorum]
MLVLITYDVNTETAEGKRRLRNVAKKCMDFGQRVQNSVFECELDYSQYLKLKDTLLKIIDSKHDSIIFYNLGNNWKRKVEHYGVHPEFFQDDILVI